MPRTFDDEMRADAARLYSAGKSCRAIARELGVAASTVSKWAKETGRSFTREQVRAAVEAHTEDLAAARLRLVGKMATAAEGMLDSIDSPYLVYNFGGNDNTYEEHTLTSPPVEVKRSIIVTAGIAFDKASRIVERDPDTGGATSVLDTLEAGLRTVVSELDGPKTDEGD